jgi:glyoxylase-like metal-dependent hydrolase (beta-lactamase superfamily II)
MTTLTLHRPGLWLTELANEIIEVRGAVIIGERAALVWDTLSHPRDMAPLQPLLTGKQVFIAYSHADWDHVWGTTGLGDAWPIIAHHVCALRFTDPADVATTLAEFRQQTPGAWDAVTLIPPTFTFGDSLALDLGGVTVELHHLPGHTPDCLVAFIPQWGVLLAGDTVETPYPIVNDGAATPKWIDLLRGWAADERVETVIPCHGEIGGRELVEHNIAYLSLLLDRAVDDESAAAAFPGRTHVNNLEKARASLTPDFTLRPLTPADRPWVAAFLAQEWGDEITVVRGTAYHPAEMAGFIALRNETPIGLVTYHRLDDHVGEIMTLNSLESGKGVGRALVDTAVNALAAQGVSRVVVVTTNDNLNALRFYQHYGFVLSILRANALATSRLVKPQIPLTGDGGLPLRDEIELSLDLSQRRLPGQPPN